MKNRVPANCKGVAYCKPIFTPAKAVDQSKQDRMASKEVLILEWPMSIP
jgi:hypothetical protein